MSRMRLRPWPFERTEEVELYWHGVPFQNAERLWMIQCLFKRQDESFKEVSYPFGTLPALRMGQIYIDGYPAPKPGRGSIYQIHLQAAVSFQMGKGFDFPRSLYAFDIAPAPGYGKLPLCKFEQDGLIYYISCIEIIRSILVPYKAWANQLLHPEGLDYFIENAKYNLEKVEINFTEEYPLDLLSNDIISYFVWLKYNSVVYNAWTSVYRNLLVETNNTNNNQNDLIKGIPLHAIPPINDMTKWTFRGIQYINHVLILELLGQTGLKSPFLNIEYYHPKKEKYEMDNKDRYIKDPKKKLLNDGDIELDTTDQGSEKTPNHIKIDQSPILFDFIKRPQVQKNTTKIRNIHGGNTIVVGMNNDGLDESKNIGTTQDWVMNGKIPQLEFSILKMGDISLSKGLEDFLKLIQYLDIKYKELSIVPPAIILLPDVKNFSRYEDGSIRTCAIVLVKRPGSLPCYLVEVGRADGWSISTLIVKLVKSENAEQFDLTINKLLVDMINNGGHWKKEHFKKEQGYSFDVSKHFAGELYARWAGRIIEKIYTL